MRGRQKYVRIWTEFHSIFGYLYTQIISRFQVNFDEKHYSELFRKEELVYLSSESENVITELKEDEVYIIGALVDHNSQKVCFE